MKKESFWKLLITADLALTSCNNISLSENTNKYQDFSVITDNPITQPVEINPTPDLGRLSPIINASTTPLTESILPADIHFKNWLGTNGFDGDTSYFYAINTGFNSFYAAWPPAQTTNFVFFFTPILTNDGIEYYPSTGMGKQAEMPSFDTNGERLDTQSFYLFQTGASFTLPSGELVSPYIGTLIESDHPDLLEYYLCLEFELRQDQMINGGDLICKHLSTSKINQSPVAEVFNIE